MSCRFGPFIRHLIVASVLVLGAPAWLALPPLQQTAEAAKQRKKKNKKKRKLKRHQQPVESDPKRTIRRESDLAPKKDFEVDESIRKTTDTRPVMEAGDRPTLTPEQLKAQRTETLLDEKLDEEIELAESLLQFEQGCDQVSAVRFRVADLYWEKAKRAFFRANDFSTPEADRNHYRAQTARLQQKTLDNYGHIIDECPGYSDYAKVLFFMGRALVELDRPKEGASYFKRVIEDFGDSEWVSQSWFMVGEYYFNTAHDALPALKAYKKAAAKPDDPIYAYSVYKMGWCHINTGDWDLAMDRFAQVVRTVDDPRAPIDDRARISLRKEALKDYVRAYSNVGEARNAYRVFTRVGGAAAVAKMLETLGNWYASQGSHQGVVVVYRELIKQFPRSTRLPVFQGLIVDATSRLGDRGATVAQVKLLTKFFRRLRQRVADGALSDEEKKTVDKDLKQAEEIAENAVRKLALDYHKDAKKLRGTARDQAYKYAQDLYAYYLDVFPEPRPDADVNYVFFMRFYYAEVLFKMEDFAKAASNYEQVVAMNPEPTDPREKEMVLAAAEEAVRSYDELVQDLDRKKPPVVSGLNKKPIPEIKLKLINACQRYIQYVGSSGEKIVEIRYKMARIYYTYNHFDKAAPAFNDIVANHPAHEVACYAANLALDIYNGDKNYKALKEKSRSYLQSKDLACGEEDRKKFAQIEEQSSFHLIKSEFEQNKKYIGAGNAYLRFYRDYPKSEFADDAVFNATVNFDLGNRLDKANEVRRFLVEKLPDSPLVPETLYNIAQSYERIVDFENAAHYLELFAKRYPKDKRSKDAIYNAGLYRSTLRDFDAGRASRERFIELYPDDPEVPKVAFSICEATDLEADLFEERAKREGRVRELDRPIAKKWEAAHNCYYRWIADRSYIRTDTDALCYGQYRRGEIMRLKTKYAKGYEAQFKYLMKNWPQWRKKNGSGKLPRCADAVAELKFREIQPALKRYRDLTISALNPTNKGQRQFQASVKSKATQRDEIAKQLQEIAGIGVAQWALASLFSIGELYRDSIEKLLQAPIPDRIPGYKLTAEDKEMLRSQLREMAAPIEQTAVEAYRICVDKANELGVYNQWSMRALQQLQKLQPEAYPPVEERIPKVAFAEELKVVSNPLVIKDGEGYKPLFGVKLQPTSQTPESPQPAAAEAAPTPSAPPAATVEAPDDGAGPETDEVGADGIPLPVEESP